MDAMIGVGLLVAAALLFAWAYGQFLRPSPKAWTQGDYAAGTITLVVVSLFAFGLAYLITFFFNFRTETHWLEIIAVVGGAFVVCWFSIPRLVAPALRTANSPAAQALSSAGMPPEPANDPHPTTPVQPGSPAGRPDKHRAA